MSFSALAQIISWIGVGYNIKAQNWWAVATFAALALFSGMVSIFSTAKNLNNLRGNNGNTN